MDKDLFNNLPNKKDEAPGKDKIVGYVYMTRDYDKFKRIETNRDVDHVARLKKSMEERYVPTVITTNDKLEIVDGQNRLEAIKELRKPLYYTVFPGLSIEDVRALNQGAKNWSKKDFVKSYATEGNETYIEYMKFAKHFPDLPPVVIETLLRLSGANDSFDKKSPNKIAYETIQRGKFLIKDLKRSYEIGEMVMRYKGIDDNPHPIYKQKQFAIALIKMANNPKFDNDELLHKITLQPTRFVRCITSHEYIKMLEKIYNYQRKGGKVRFDTD